MEVGVQAARNSAQVVVVAGRLDIATVADVRPRLHAAISACSGDLVIDLAGVETIDVTGLGALVGAQRRAARAGRRLRLRAVPAPVMGALASTRLYRALPVERARVAVA
jgi:anti-anti-sigma factor